MSEPEPQAGEMDKQGSDVDSNGSEVGDSQEIGPVGVDVGASAWQTSMQFCYAGLVVPVRLGHDRADGPYYNVRSLVIQLGRHSPTFDPSRVDTLLERLLLQSEGVQFKYIIVYCSIALRLLKIIPITNSM